jgi:hypothetical protein
LKSSNSIHRSNCLDSDGIVHTRYSSVWLQNSPLLHNQQELATFYVGNFFIRMYHFNETAGSLTYVTKLLLPSHITVTLVYQKRKSQQQFWMIFANFTHLKRFSLFYHFCRHVTEQDTMQVLMI